MVDLHWIFGHLHIHHGHSVHSAYVLILHPQNHSFTVLSPYIVQGSQLAPCPEQLSIRILGVDLLFITPCLPVSIDIALCTDKEDWKELRDGLISALVVGAGLLTLTMLLG